MPDLESYIGLIESKLNENADQIRQQWKNPIGTTTRHFVIDQLLPEDICQAIYTAFPKDGTGFFNRNLSEKKRKHPLI